MILSSPWGSDKACSLFLSWGWEAGCVFFLGIGDQHHLWWGSLSSCPPPEACHLRGPWLFPLDESVPALSGVRVLESLSPFFWPYASHCGSPLWVLPAVASYVIRPLTDLKLFALFLKIYEVFISICHVTWHIQLVGEMLKYFFKIFTDLVSSVYTPYCTPWVPAKRLSHWHSCFEHGKLVLWSKTLLSALWWPKWKGNSKKSG